MLEINGLPDSLEVFRGKGWRIDTDIPFLGEDRLEKMDLYVPGGNIPALRAAILIIHGGGWRTGDKRNLRELSFAYVSPGGRTRGFREPVSRFFGSTL